MWFRRWKRKSGEAIADLMRQISPSRRTSAEVAPSRSEHHLASFGYWQKCSCTFLASDPTYYDRQEALLRDLLKHTVVHTERALDVGCGNGRFSLVIAEFADTTLAFDLSPTLIAQASSQAALKGVSNLAFQVLNLEEGLPDGPYDLAACMGVVSTIIDDSVYDELLDRLGKVVGERGYLFTKDSLSHGADDKLIVTETYVTKYRSEARYERDIAARGFQLLDKAQLAKTDLIANSLYLWRKG